MSFLNVDLYLSDSAVHLNGTTITMTVEELTAIRPAHGLVLPEGERNAFYAEDTAYSSNGFRHLALTRPWTEAEALLNDETLVADLVTHRATVAAAKAAALAALEAGE